MKLVKLHGQILKVYCFNRRYLLVNLFRATYLRYLHQDLFGGSILLFADQNMVAALQPG